MISEVFKACFSGPISYRIFSVVLLFCIFYWFYLGNKIGGPKTPELDIYISGTDLKLENEGQVNITDVELVGVVGVHFNMASQQIGTTCVESPHHIMFSKIKSGSEVKYPIEKMVIKLGKKPNPPNEIEAYCFVLRFRRPSDRRSYVRTIKVMKATENKKKFFFPMQAMKGTTMASTSSEWPLGTLPEKLDKICRERFSQYF